MCDFLHKSLQELLKNLTSYLLIYDSCTFYNCHILLLFFKIELAWRDTDLLCFAFGGVFARLEYTSLEAIGSV